MTELGIIELSSEHGPHAVDAEYHKYDLSVLLVVVGFVLGGFGIGLWFREVLERSDSSLALDVALRLWIGANLLAVILRWRFKRKLLPAALVFGSILLLPFVVGLYLDLKTSPLHSLTHYEKNELIGIAAAVFASICAVGWRFPACSLPAWAGVAFFAWALLGETGDLRALQELFFALGTFTLVLSINLSYVTSINYSFWLNKVGLLALAFGSGLFVDGDRAEWPILVMAVALLIGSVFFRFPSYLATGCAALLTYINVNTRARVDVATFAMSLAAQGALLVGLSIALQRAEGTTVWKRAVASAARFQARIRQREFTEIR